MHREQSPRRSSAGRRRAASRPLAAAATVAISLVSGVARAEDRPVLAPADGPARAQTASPGESTVSPAALARGAQELGIVAGGAFSVIPMGGLEDDEVAGRRVALLSLRYSRVLLRRGPFALQYYGDLTPLVVETADLVAAEDGSGGLERKTAYGAGVAPLGARLSLRPDARLRPYLGVSGGVMLLSEEVPLPGSRKYAFSGDVEAGVQYRLGETRSLSAGVRFHHISNADTGDTNPGLNAVVLFAGVSASR